jgi:hypothetical protein
LEKLREDGKRGKELPNADTKDKHMMDPGELRETAKLVKTKLYL